MKELWQKMGLQDKEKRRLWQLGGLLLVGLLLMAASGGLGAALAGPPQEPLAQTVAQAEPLSAEEALERRLAAILSQIQGAGQVSVSLTFSRSAQAEYASNVSTTVRTTDETSADGQVRTTNEQTSTDSMVLASGSSGPVLLKESMAEVQGVLVVAEGGGNPSVRAQIAEALQNLLAVPAHKIVICQAGS